MRTPKCKNGLCHTIDLKGLRFSVWLGFLGLGVQGEFPGLGVDGEGDAKTTHLT